MSNTQGGREMSDTPETDEIALHPATTAWVWREHSRKLERERDKAREQRDAWEKVAISNAEKLGCLLFGKAEGGE